MSLALLQRFAPFIPLASKPLGQITDGEMSALADALSGGPNEELVDLFRATRESDPEILASKVLGSPYFKEQVAKFKAKKSEEASELFCECPHCGAMFSTNLGAQ